MQIINPVNVVLLLLSHYHGDQTATSPEERNLANKLKDIIDDSVKARIDLHEVEELFLGKDDDYREVNIPVPGDTGDDKLLSSTEKSADGQDYIDLEYKRKAIEFWAKGKKSFKSVQHNFKRLKSKRELYRWQKQVNVGGTRFDKLKLIKQAILEKFKEAQNRTHVHDVDLKVWAMEANGDAKLEGFHASSGWIHNFKKENGIKSRKITKFVSQDFADNETDLLATTSLFVGDTREIIDSRFFLKLENVLNTDQGGFEKELHSGRSLTFTGTKKVFVGAQSLNALTHSYTIQPTVSASGELLPVMLVILQETNGVVGPRVQKEMFKAPNLIVYPSSSGKVTKWIYKDWLKNGFYPYIDSPTLLLIDSLWGKSTEELVQECAPENFEICTRVIPKDTTGYCQPLDVYGFRVWKNYVKTFSDRMLIRKEAICLYQRNNILKLQSLCHNQFSSPRFKELWRYGWYRAGYIEDHPAFFVTPVQFGLNLKELEKVCVVCESMFFFRCTWCKEYFCVNHGFVNLHYCKEYVP